MRDIFTFSQLGHYGALGNQLFQIAGVLGEAAKVEADVYFPEWEYAPYFQVDEELFEEKTGEYVDFWPGYLQELEHFEDIEVVIKDMFQPSDMAKDLIAEHYPWHDFNKRIVGVHVRRANNMYLPEHHPVSTLEYFEQALDIVPHDSMLVCSDDLNWCRQQSIFKDAYFGMGPPENIDILRLTDAHPLTTEEAVTDLFLLSMCDSHIISNSSFSWWAAWLGEGEHVIRPERWYGPALQNIDVNAMMPDEWIAI